MIQISQNLETKDLSRKQIILLIDNKNKIEFMASSSDHVVNLNRALKNIKSDIMADYVCMEQYYYCY